MSEGHEDIRMLSISAGAGNGGRRMLQELKVPGVWKVGVGKGEEAGCLNGGQVGTWIRTAQACNHGSQGGSAARSCPPPAPNTRTHTHTHLLHRYTTRSGGPPVRPAQRRSRGPFLTCSRPPPAPPPAPNTHTHLLHRYTKDRSAVRVSSTPGLSTLTTTCRG